MHFIIACLQQFITLYHRLSVSIETGIIFTIPIMNGIIHSIIFNFPLVNNRMKKCSKCSHIHTMNVTRKWNKPPSTSKRKKKTKWINPWRGYDESQSKCHVMMMNYDGHINLAPRLSKRRVYISFKRAPSRPFDRTLVIVSEQNWWIAFWILHIYIYGYIFMCLQYVVDMMGRCDWPEATSKKKTK